MTTGELLSACQAERPDLQWQPFVTRQGEIGCAAALRGDTWLAVAQLLACNDQFRAFAGPLNGLGASPAEAIRELETEARNRMWWPEAVLAGRRSLDEAAR